MNWRFLILILGIILLAGCIGGQNKTPEKIENLPNESISKSQDMKKFEIPKTPLDKLNYDYKDGKIDKKDYIFYSLEALYDPKNIPKEYEGAPITNYDATDEIMLAIENWDSLPQNYKEKIETWIALPDITNSKKLDLKAERSYSKTILFSGESMEVLTVEAIPGKAKIIGSLPPGSNDADRYKLQTYIGYVSKGIQDSWNKFKDMLALEPTEEVYFYVKTVPAGMLGTATIRKTVLDPVKRCRIEIDPAQTITETKTRSVTAHELFHCYQYYIPLTNWGNTDEKWLREATATWSENVIYPEYNREWNFLDAFFNSRSAPLITSEGNKPYSDYMFFLFLQQNNGNEWSVIKPLLAAKTKGVKGALKDIENYDSKFADFVAWNWNKDPMKKYADFPSFPSKEIAQQGRQDFTVVSKEESEAVYSVGGGSATYHIYNIPEGTGVKQITFNFKSHGDAQRQRRALVKIGDHWEDQSWTYLMNKRFCLTKPEEKVSEIILMLSDSNLDSDNIAFTSYEVDTTGECPFEISGTTRITHTTSIDGSGNGAVGGTYMTGTYVSNDVLQYDEEERAYKLKTRMASCTYNEKTDAADSMYSIKTVKSGSGTTAEEYGDITEAPLKIRFHDDEDIIDFFVYPDYNNPEWVSYSSTVTTVIGGTSTTQNIDEKDACTFVSAMGYLTELDKTYVQNNHLKGTKSMSKNGISSIVEFDYTLQQE